MARVNARLDAKQSRRLEHLSKMTGATVSDVVKRAIDLYYEAMIRERPSAAELMQKEGFVGGAAGAVDLSETYKTLLHEVLAAKHDHR
jgi:hypothetical protein